MVSEAINSYSRMSMAMGLISFFLPGPSSDAGTMIDLRETMSKVIRALDKTRNMEGADSQALVENVTQKYLELKVSSHPPTTNLSLPSFSPL